MDNSKSISAIVGPTLIVIVVSELKLWNPTLYDSQIVPLVYVSGILLFIAGLSIVRNHNFWLWKWPLMLTLIGWFGILLGLTRMFFPQINKSEFKNDTITFGVELILIFIGIILSFKAFSPKKVGNGL